MNIKDELEKYVPANIKLTEKEKINIRNRVIQSRKRRLYMKPLLVSIGTIMIASILLIPSIKSTFEENPPLEQISISDDNHSSTIVTEEQKQQYHKEYEKIVEKVMDRKLGLSISVTPIEEFKESDWVSPEEYEKMIQNIVDIHLETEHEKIAEMSSYLKPAVTNVEGETSKSTYLYFSGPLVKIDVTAKFDTQYNAKLDRQLFTAVENVSTDLSSSSGKWEQTSYDAFLVDGGKKYRIQIEGIFEATNLSFEKKFIIEFNCDENGNIK